MDTHSNFIATDNERTAIYGIGASASEAIADALSECAELTDLIAIPATGHLCGMVERCGGAIAWEHDVDGVARVDQEVDVSAYRYACKDQGFEGSYDEWQSLPAAERLSYEDGAAVVDQD